MATTTARKQHTVQTSLFTEIPTDEEFVDMDKELYTPEEAYELTMKDIKAIYEDVYYLGITCQHNKALIRSTLTHIEGALYAILLIGVIPSDIKMKKVFNA